MAGLDSTGFTTKVLSEVISDLEGYEKEFIDSNISTESDEVLGQLNTTIGTPLQSQYDLGQAVYDAFNPLTAEGVSLDNLAALISITRIAGAASTTEFQLLTGTEGASITQGSIIENPINGDRFTMDSTTVLSLSSCVSATYTVKQVLNTTEYTLTINGNVVTYTSDADATAAEIVAGLKAYNDVTYTSATWTLTVDGATDELTIATSDSSDISISSITYISADSVSDYASASSVEISGVVAPSESVTGIITTTSGWVSTSNTASYIVGRETETDTELRARLLVSQQASSKGTLEAIIDSLNNVAGVSSATVAENVTMVDNTGSGGLPPKSFEAVVQGGLDGDIGLAIWEAKPAGIESYGDTPEVIVDSEGENQTVYFTRPTIFETEWTITWETAPGASTPLDVETTIQTAVVSYVDSLGVGVDVIPSAVYPLIYDALAGIIVTLIEVRELSTGSYVTDVLPVSSDSFANAETGNISVTGA